MTSFEPATYSPPSPFLSSESKLQIAWDSTTFGMFKTCPRLYQYWMIEGWRAKGENIHLRFGLEYHQALQDYDIERAEGISHEDALHDVVRELFIRTIDFNPDKSEKPGKYKNRDSLLRSVIDYLDNQRQNDTLKTYILQNGRPAVELSFRFELGFGPDISDQPYLLCGHIDRVCSDDDILYGEDHKTTTSSLGDYFYAQFEPNNQMSLYTFALQIILGTPVRGIIINGVQLLVDDTRFGRHITHRTPDQLEEWVTDLSRWLAMAEWYAEHNYWPQNDTACDKYGGCAFRKVCSKSPSVREIYLKSDFIKLPEEERWNPLKPR